MGEKIIKIRCTLCNGKISADESYYRELAGSKIPCPHCGRQILIPGPQASVDVKLKPVMANSAPSPSRSPAPPAHAPMMQSAPPSAPVANNTMAVTQQIQPMPQWEGVSVRGPVGGKKFCPKCHEEVGPRDKVCIGCGSSIP